MNARFHAPDANAEGDLLALPPDEARHLARVLRLKTGDRIRIFNGRGAEFEGVVERVARNGVHVRTGARCDAAVEARVAITLALAVLKGDKMDDVVRDAVMLGAAGIQPLITTRTEVTAPALARGNRIGRWERIAVSSAKQCGRAVVPTVASPISFDEIPNAFSDLRLPRPAILLTEPGASSNAVSVRDLQMAAPEKATILIGPEGGWTPQEVAWASATCTLVTLGGLTLRADAVPTVALTALFTKWGEL